MVSGPVLLKKKGTSLIFMRSGFKRMKKYKDKMKNWDEIGQMLVSGALVNTKKMRKSGADIFAKSGPEKLHFFLKNQDFLREFSRLSRGLSQKPVNSRTNGWEPFFVRFRCVSGGSAQPHACYSAKEVRSAASKKTCVCSIFFVFSSASPVIAVHVGNINPKAIPVGNAANIKVKLL